MEDYFKTHTIITIVIIIAAMALIGFLIRRNRKDEKPFERDAGESVKNEDELI